MEDVVVTLLCNGGIGKHRVALVTFLSLVTSSALVSCDAVPRLAAVHAEVPGIVVLLATVRYYGATFNGTTQADLGCGGRVTIFTILTRGTRATVLAVLTRLAVLPILSILTIGTGLSVLPVPPVFAIGTDGVALQVGHQFAVQCPIPVAVCFLGQAYLRGVAVGAVLPGNALLALLALFTLFSFVALFTLVTCVTFIPLIPFLAVVDDDGVGV